MAPRRSPSCGARAVPRAELEALRQDQGVYHPFICENGGGVYVPHAYFPFAVPDARDVAGYHVIEFGRPYSDVVEILRTTAARLRIAIVGFGDMSIDQVAVECRMPLLRARLAKLREYTELFRVVNETPTARVRLRRALHAAHLTSTIEAPYSCVGAPVDPKLGIGLLTAMYRRLHGEVITVNCLERERVLRGEVATSAEWIEGVVATASDAREGRLEPCRVAVASESRR